MSAWVCSKCLSGDAPGSPPTSLLDLCARCGCLTPQLAGVLGKLVHITPVANAPPPEAIPFDAAAKMLACGVAQVRALVRQRKLRRAASAGRSPLVLRESVLEYLRSEPELDPVPRPAGRRRRTTTQGETGPSLIDSAAIRDMLKKG
jgi:hypothetical protein